MWSIHVGSNVQILEKELSEREQEVGGQEKEDKGSFNTPNHEEFQGHNNDKVQEITCNVMSYLKNSNTRKTKHFLLHIQEFRI